MFFSERMTFKAPFILFLKGLWERRVYIIFQMPILLFEDLNYELCQNWLCDYKQINLFKSLVKWTNLCLPSLSDVHIEPVQMREYFEKVLSKSKWDTFFNSCQYFMLYLNKCLTTRERWRTLLLILYMAFFVGICTNLDSFSDFYF